MLALVIISALLAGCGEKKETTTTESKTTESKSTTTVTKTDTSKTTKIQTSEKKDSSILHITSHMVEDFMKIINKDKI